MKKTLSLIGLACVGLWFLAMPLLIGCAGKPAPRTALMVPKVICSCCGCGDGCQCDQHLLKPAALPDALRGPDSMHDRTGKPLKTGDKVTVLATIRDLYATEEFCNVDIVTDYGRRPDGKPETISAINTAVLDKIDETSEAKLKLPLWRIQNDASAGCFAGKV